MAKKITVKIECTSCSGTGLYKGAMERDACAVICSTCGGTGMQEFTYTPFSGRKEATGIRRVFEASFGFIHSDQDVRTHHREIHFSKFGASYEDWKRGIAPKPVEDLDCPAYWNYYNHRDIHPCSRCRSGCNKVPHIRDCYFSDDKAKCWKEWHKNNDKPDDYYEND